MPTAPGGQTWRLLAVLLVATVLITLVALGASFALGMPGYVRGTLMQSAFRGNLAYIGIPVLAYSFSETQAGDGNRAMATAVIVIVLTMAAYNVLAVIVLQASNHSVKGADWRQLMRTIATNPLLLSWAARPACAPLGSNIAFFSPASAGIAGLCLCSHRIDVHRRLAGDNSTAWPARLDHNRSAPQSSCVTCAGLLLVAPCWTRTCRRADHPCSFFLSDCLGRIHHGPRDGWRRSARVRLNRPEHHAFPNQPRCCSLVDGVNGWRGVDGCVPPATQRSRLGREVRRL